MAARKKTAHRNWGAHGQKVPGRHSGDIMTQVTRSRAMSQIRSKDTTPERMIAAALRDIGLDFEQHSSDLAGKPDFVFRDAKVTVFVDGNFWHGFRFPLWEHKLIEKWRDKIAATRSRDSRNFAKLRRLGWRVLRIWEHQVESDSSACAERIAEAINNRP